MIQGGSGGIVQSTTGNVECQLDNENTHIKLATRGSKKHTILLGNMNTETIVENQLTIRGKLVLSDDSIVEKHVSVVHELQNIVELACQNSNSSSTYDYGLVAKQRDKTSGVIYDHIRDMFYFSTELGSYQQNRFSLPKQYATVQAKSYIAQQKITSPYIESHCVQSRLFRCGKDNTICLQSPLVQCSERLVCSSLQSDLNNSVRITSHMIQTKDLHTKEKLSSNHVHTNTLTIGKTFEADKWFYNTIGPNGFHPTLQDYLDASDDLRNTSKSSSTPEQTYPTQHAVF